MLFSQQEFLYTPSSALRDDTLSPFLHLIPAVIHIWLFVAYDAYSMLKELLVTFKSLTTCMLKLYFGITSAYKKKRFLGLFRRNLQRLCLMMHTAVHVSLLIVLLFHIRFQEIWLRCYNMFMEVMDCTHNMVRNSIQICPCSTIWCQTSSPNPVRQTVFSRFGLVMAHIIYC